MSDFQPRFLHCRIRVRDIDRSVKFYSDLFGFKKLRESTSPAGNRLAFLEMPGNNTLIELCYQPDSPDFDFPEDIFHFAFSVPDLDAFRKGGRRGLNSGRKMAPWEGISTLWTIRTVMR